MPDPAQDQAGSYADLASELDDRLDEDRRRIRCRLEAGEISSQQAAGERCAALESHLSALRELRTKGFGEGSQR